jgi:hypothetical protein
MKRRQNPRGSYFENGAKARPARAAALRCPVEVSVAPFDQPGLGLSPIDARKGMEQREGARRGYLENGALVKHVARPAAGQRRPIEVSVAPLD